MNNLLKNISPENQIYLKELTKSFAETKANIWSKIINKKKCLTCGSEATKRCSKCSTAFFCSNKCEKNSKKDHKTNCLENRKLSTSSKITIDEVNNLDENNNVKSVIYSPAQNKNECYICSTKEDLKIFYGSLFCEKCLEKQICLEQKIKNT